MFFRSIVFVLAITAFSQSHADKINLPDIGDSSGTTISPDEEQKLGRNLFRYLRQNNLILDDPIIQEYIDSLGYKLVSNSDQPARRFTFFIVKDSGVNAFAAPGGYIGIHSGLFLITRNESELAAVIAHEIAHVTQKHMSRRFESAKKHSLATTIAIIAAALIGSKNSELAQAALSAGVAANTQLQLNFSRAHEKEADFMGIKTLIASNFNPEGMAGVFERMHKAARLYGPEIPEFLSTHPVTSHRISEARNRALSIKLKKPEEDHQYKLIKTYLQIHHKNPNEATKYFSAKFKQKKNNPAVRYGLVMSLLKAGQAKEANKLIQPLIHNDPENISYRILEANIALQLNDFNKSNNIYSKLLKLYPLNMPLVYHYANSLLQSGQADKSRNILQEYLEKRKGYPRLYKLLAQASHKTGQQAEAYFYEAEFNFMNGNTRLAIQLLTNASKIKNTDFYLASKIESRLAAMKQIALQEKK